MPFNARQLLALRIIHDISVGLIINSRHSECDLLTPELPRLPQRFLRRNEAMDGEGLNVTKGTIMLSVMPTLSRTRTMDDCS
jgi:hypothetical protein